MSWYYFRPYVSVAKRRAKAAREVEKRRKKGQTVSPVVIEGRIIAKTFWGKAWCENLESYSDFSNRLPRGRTYVRNGSVVDLQIEAGKIRAMVSGSELYNVKISIAALPGDLWKTVKTQCAGKIGSLVELLQGRLSQHVMDVVSRKDRGLFPQPREIKMSCSCPDWAGMCKHVAAVLYGVGARLDRQPEFLFHLRQVDHLELIQEATTSAPAGSSAKRGKRTIASGDLAEVFGIELGDGDVPKEAPPALDELATSKGRRSPTAAKAARTPRKARARDQAAGSAPVEGTSASTELRPKRIKAREAAGKRAARSATRRPKMAKKRSRLVASTSRQRSASAQDQLQTVQ